MYASPATILDLSTLTLDEGFIIQGDAAYDYAGASVSSAGDINGDGIDDMIIGASGGDDGGLNAGEAYVIYGTTSATRGTIDLTGLAATDGFIIQGDAEDDFAGYSVSSAGDINGDGIDDVIIGATFNWVDGDRFAGDAYVIYGATGATRGPIDLASLASSDGFIIQGDVADNFAGTSVSSAGDINGDGVDDVIVGAPFGDDSGDNAGEAYVIYGTTGATRGPIDLSNLSVTDGFIIQGDMAGDLAGYSVSSAGDINDDGIDDVIIGDPGGLDGGNRAGKAYVIYGKTGATRDTIELASLASSDGFIIQGAAADDWAGFSVSSAGDINGDGIDDMIIGALGADGGGSFAGEAYVIYGTTGETRGTIDLASLSSSDGFIIQGDEMHDQAGNRVSSAGDINGDGIDDMIVGGHYGDDGGTSAGEAYVIYGHRPTEAVVRWGTDIGQTIFGGDMDDTLYGAGGNDRLDGGGGADEMIGGTGRDFGSYFYASAGVVVSLTTTSGATGDAVGDTFRGVENLVGSVFDDSLTGDGNRNKLQGRLGDDLLRGGQGADRLFGGGGDDILNGGRGADSLSGRSGDDLLRGGQGADKLNGGRGHDILAGGDGADVFEFSSLSHSTVDPLGQDRIKDFSGHAGEADQLDLSAILTGGHFSATGALSGSAGEVISMSQGADTLVLADANGDGIADFAVLLAGTIALADADFIFV